MELLAVSEDANQAFGIFFKYVATLKIQVPGLQRKAVEVPRRRRRFSISGTLPDRERAMRDLVFPGKFEPLGKGSRDSMNVSRVLVVITHELLHSSEDVLLSVPEGKRDRGLLLQIKKIIHATALKM